MLNPSLLSLICTVMTVVLPLADSSAAKPAPELPRTPDLADTHYGPEKMQVFDLWKAKSDQPCPLVVRIHGGGFVSGSKGVTAETVNSYLQQGISFMDISYRLTPEVALPTHHLDCARAVQFARASAKEWNIDPKRIAATGSSAGGCSALWLAFHDDLADPRSADPILRESTRLTCAFVHSAQTSLDPRVVKEWIGDVVMTHPAWKNPALWGLKPDEFNTPKACALQEACSPIAHLTRDDPPVWMAYGIPKEPLTLSSAIHHRNYGLRLKEQMDKLGIECVILIGHAKRGEEETPFPFLLKQFGMKPAK